VTGSHHCKVASIGQLEHLVESVGIVRLGIVMERLRRHAHNVTGSKAGKTTLSASIGSVKLCPRFLKDRDPDLTITARCESWLAARTDRKEVVNNHRSFLAIQKEAHQVDASLVNVFRHKQLLDTIWEFCERTKRC